MSTLSIKELSHPSGEVIKIASGKTLDSNSQGTLVLPTVPHAKMPSGSVLQVISASNTNTANGGFLLTTSSASYTAGALSASITPSSTSSKIMVIINTVQYRAGSSSYTVYRTTSSGSTNIGGGNNGFARLTGANNTWLPMSISYLDSPNTASAVTYQLYGRAEAGGVTYFGGDGDMKSTITLMEVSA